MALFCSSCNAPSPAEARFCRLCGAPLKTAAGSSGPVSPLAQTVPLIADGRTTDGLPADDSHRNVDTVRVSTEDLDAILQGRHAAQQRAGANGGDGSSAPLRGENYGAPTTSSLVMPTASRAQSNAPQKRRWWPVVLLSILSVATAGALLIYYFTHRGSNPGEPAVVSIDQRKAVEFQLSEARSLLATGNLDEAIARLHSAVDLDPSNVEAHRLLGAALMQKGLRRQAIDEYFLAAQRDPKHLPTLHALASLQFQEQLYADAVDSYRRLAGAMGDARLAPQDQLNYADALRLAGYTEDARLEYQKIIAAGPPDIAATAKKNLAQMPAPMATSAQVDTRNVSPGKAGTTTGAPASASPPAVTQNPGTAKPSPPPAQTGADADYSLGVSIVGGRDPRNIPRADLLRALGILQRAARGGQHRDQAAQLAERLGKEFDRRKSLGIQ